MTKASGFILITVIVIKWKLVMMLSLKLTPYACRQLCICQTLIFYSRFKEIQMLICKLRDINVNYLLCIILHKQTSFDVNKMFIYRKRLVDNQKPVKQKNWTCHTLCIPIRLYIFTKLKFHVSNIILMTLHKVTFQIAIKYTWTILIFIK